MKRTHGLVSLAILHHVTVGIALLAMLGGLFNSDPSSNFIGVLQLCAFGFFSVIVRRAWASIDGGSEGMSPGKAQGFLWIPFFNFYWVFPALVSLATQTNAKSDSEQNPAGRITRGFGLVIAILFGVTTLTDLLAGRHPLLTWVNLLTYATYVGFTVTYIWQIRRSAAAFDAQSVPAVREPAKMPSVGVAGIIYGCACAALLCLTLAENLTMSPEIIEQRLKAKGYAVTTSDATFEPGDFEKMKGVISMDDIKVINVSKSGELVGYVFYATIRSNDAAELIAKRYGTKTLKAGNKVLFQATIPGRNARTHMPIEEWLASF
jgi:hypothetical protein